MAAWRFGIPTSESHALVAGISGAAAALEGSLSCIRWDCWSKVILGLVMSTTAGFCAGRLAHGRLRAVKASPRTLRVAQLPGAAAAAFLHGAQDGQKFIGVFLLGTALAQGRADEGAFVIPLWLMGLCAGFMALGTLMGGRRIIDTVGREMVSLGPKEGLAADLASTACLLGATLLEVLDVLKEEGGVNPELLPIYLTGMAVAAVVGYCSIYLVKLLSEKGKFGLFAFYCWAAGALSLLGIALDFHFLPTT